MSSSNEQLFELLKDPIRSRIMFEFMLNQKITIKKLSHLLNKDRTTINYHLKMFLDADIIHKIEKISHSRGKPTIVYSLKNSVYKVEKNLSGKSIETITNSLVDQAKNLNMITAVTEQSHEVLKLKNSFIENVEKLVSEHHMLLMNQEDVSKFYQGLHQYISKFMEEHNQKNSDQMKSDLPIQKYLFYAGIFPIIRDTDILEKET